MALDECRYDPRTAQPTEGTVVDADEDLVALCSRMQATDSKHCAILYCEEQLPDDAPPHVGPPDAQSAQGVPLTPGPGASRASLEHGLEDGLAVLDGDLEVDGLSVLLAQLGARVPQALGDGVVGDGRGRLVLPPLASTYCA